MNKLFLTLLYFSFCVSLNSQIQTISTQKTFGTGFNEIDYNSKVYDNFIYLFVTPETAGISQDKTVAGYNIQDGWFIKMDLNFNVIEQFVYGGNYNDRGIDFVKCANGDFILLLTSNSDVSGNKTLPTFGIGDTDYWVIRINSSGAIVWQKTYGGTDEELGSEIVKINENKFLIFGTSRSPISGNKTIGSFGLSDGYSVFIDGQGNILHQHVYGGDGPEFNGNVSINLNENKIVYGLISASSISGNKTTDKNGFFDGWVFTTDTNGVLINQINLGGLANTYNEVWDVSFTANNKIVALLAADYGIGGNKTLSGSGQSDAWLVQLDYNLNITDQKVFGGSLNEACNSMFQSSNKTILSLVSYSGMDGNKTEPNYGSFDNWFVCIDDLGNILWQKTVGGSEGENAMIVSEPTTNNYIIVSNTVSPISGNKTVPLYVSSSSDLWLFKLNSTLSVESLTSDIDLTVAPNPFEDVVSFSWKDNQEKVILEILDLQGKLIESRIILNDSGVMWSPENLTSGVYLYQVITDNGIGTGRIVKK